MSASEGARRAELLTAELPVLRLQAAEMQSAADAERQELTARHVAHVQVGRECVPFPISSPVGTGMQVPRTGRDYATSIPGCAYWKARCFFPARR